MDAAVAAVIAAMIGGLTGLFSSTIPLLLSGRNLKQQLDADVRKTEISILLGQRQNALETLWFMLTEHNELSGLSDDARRSYISATLWAPQRLRTLCLQALSSNTILDLRKARTELVQQVNRMERVDV